MNTKIKVTCLNLWQGGLLWEQMTGFLQKQASDFYLLQEAYNGPSSLSDQRFKTVTELGKLFPRFYLDFCRLVGDQRRKEGIVENGNMILSRFPIINSQAIFFDVPYGVYDHDGTSDFTAWPAGLQAAGLKLPDGQVLSVANIHGPVWLDGSAYTKRRQAMIKGLNAWLVNKEQVIMAGDSNAKRDNPCWQDLTNSVISPLPSNLISTFNMKRKNHPGYGQAAVDIVFVSQNIKVKKAEVLADADVSDHLPIQLELMVK